jgi:hypothetical protein
MNDFKIYLFFEEPTEERLQELNEEISRNKQHLYPSRYEYRTVGTVALLTQIEETTIQTQRLHPDRDSKAAQPRFQDALFGTDYTKPVTIDYQITTGAPSLPGMIESLQEADKVQNAHLEGLKITAARVKQNLP